MEFTYQEPSSFLNSRKRVYKRYCTFITTLLLLAIDNRVAMSVNSLDKVRAIRYYARSIKFGKVL